MSKERLNELLSALRDDGWEVQNVDDLFRVENQTVCWILVKNDKNLEIIVEFSLFDDLGRRTELLKDILYGVVQSGGPKIYFDKQPSPSWRRNVKEFVKALSGEE